MKLGVCFFKIASLYLLLGLVMGIGMEIAQDHSLSGVHAHINLVGWASMALFGLVYVLFPKAGESALAKIHFWLYNLSLPLFMIGLAFVLMGDPSLMILLQIFPNLLVLSVLLFVVNVFMNVKTEDVRAFFQNNTNTSR